MTLLQRSEFLCLLAFILNTLEVLTEIPITQVPGFAVFGQCGQKCIQAISSEFSTDLGCPLLNPAACLYSSGPGALVATAAQQCAYASCTATASAATNQPVDAQVCAILFSSWFEVNGIASQTEAPSSTILGRFSHGHNEACIPSN